MIIGTRLTKNKKKNKNNKKKNRKNKKKNKKNKKENKKNKKNQKKAIFLNILKINQEVLAIFCLIIILILHNLVSCVN